MKLKNLKGLSKDLSMMPFTDEIIPKGIELIKWVLEKLKNPDIPICEIMESKMNEIIDKINQIDDAIEADPLHSELRIWNGFFIGFVVTK
jgi:hypothetical protein